MRISVVIPLYNKKDTILHTLNSVFNQTSQPKEIIVVNDGSTDGSESIVNELHHPLIRLINQTNSGVSAARNKGIEESDGDWIAFLDADDEWLPDYLAAMLNLSDIFPECSVLASSYFLQSDGNRKKIILNNLSCNEYGILRNYFLVASLSHPPICSSAVVVRKTALWATGGFPVGVTSGEDLLTWARLAVRNRIGYSLEALAVFNQNPIIKSDGMPSRIPQLPDQVGNELALLWKQNRNLPGLKRYVAHWHKMRASVYLRLGVRKGAMIESFKSLSFNPLNIKLYCYFFLLFMPSSFIGNTFRKLGNA